MSRNSVSTAARRRQQAPQQATRPTPAPSADEAPQPAELALQIGPVGAQRGTGRIIYATGRTAEIVMAVLSHASDLTSPKGTLQLDWGPNGVQGRAVSLWDNTISSELLARLGLLDPDAARERQHPVVEELGTGIAIRGDEVAPWHLDPSGAFAPSADD